MSEEDIQELMDYNLEYMEAQQSEEIFGGNYTSAVDLKYANKKIEKLENQLNKQKEVIDKIKEYLNKVQLGELENGKSYTFKDFLKEEKDAEIEEAEWLLELLEEIE